MYLENFKKFNVVGCKGSGRKMVKNEVEKLVMVWILIKDFLCDFEGMRFILKKLEYFWKIVIYGWKLYLYLERLFFK